MKLFSRIHRDKNDPNTVGGRHIDETTPVETEDHDNTPEHGEYLGRRPKQPKNHHPGFFKKNWWWMVIVVIVILLAVAIEYYSNQPQQPVAAAPAPVVPVVVDTTGAFAQALAEKAHADSMAVEAHADSLNNAEYNYKYDLEQKLAGASEEAVPDSLVKWEKEEYYRLLGDEEADGVIVALEKVLGSSSNTKKPAGKNTTATQQKPNTTPTGKSYDVVKSVPHKQYSTEYRNYHRGESITWNVMRADPNIETSFVKNIASIPDETSDFKGCPTQIPKVVKDSLTALYLKAVETKDDPKYVTLESFNNEVIDGITRGEIYAGTKNKVQVVALAPIRVFIKSGIDNTGTKVNLTKINRKRYSVVLTAEQAKSMKLPDKFIPPAGKKIRFNVANLGDGYGNVPQCNNTLFWVELI